MLILILRKEVTMDYNISEQIDRWTKKLDYYKSKESSLKQRITDAESKRDSINNLPVGSIFIDKYYKQLDSLYIQLATLPAKIRHCIDNITTLKCEL